ncbi:MAG: DUF4159 domain-containing protein [Pirellulales bacterium]|nr:DUF4159 domain-containing protein [Pirellulales bacterium]
MKCRITVALLAGVLVGSFGSTLRAEISAEQVRQAIDRGVAYLKQQQRPDGSWPEFLGHPGGVTALCTLALLECGVEPDDEHVDRALGYLRKLKPDKTYMTSLQTMVFCKAGAANYNLLISRNVKWLQSKQITTGLRTGAWGYPEANGDNSNSQFALLALNEAERVGVAVSGQTWRLAKAYWEDCQNADGSWGYYKGVAGTGSMTSAGIASLVITGGKVRASNAKASGDRIQCCGQSEGENERVERALRWLGRNFSVSRNPGSPGSTWLLYYLYGVERVGRLTAQRFLGGHDWYRAGADWLIHSQDNLSGYWKGTGHAEDNPLVATSLSLLFLSKGRRPPLLAKLKHTPADDWNRHQNDVDNLTRFVESRWKRDLTWQVVDVQAAKIEDLLRAPVVYLCGNQSPLPPAPDQQKRLAEKLRGYIDRGGFLFVEAYCGGGAFDQGFRELMRQVFPEPEYRLHLLEPGHPIWRVEMPVDPDHLRPLWGIEFGCRTSVVYAPADPPGNPRPSLSCLWELSRSGRGQEFSEDVQAQIDAGLALGINVLAYATNRDLKGGEEYFDLTADQPPRDPLMRGRLSIAKLRHPGGCNAAPRALVNLLETAGQQLGIRVDTSENLIHVTDATLFDHHLVFMHGRNRFSFSPQERLRLKTFVERGGMLLADSICASKAFTESFRREISEIFPDRKLEPIAGSDPMWTPTYGGFDLQTVTRRDPQAQDGAGPLKATLRKVPLEMEGIRIDDRWGVVFSPFDISCALEKHDSLECRGYVRQDAARIGLNVILYSLQQ